MYTLWCILWCYIEGDNTCFLVIVSPTITIHALKEKIKEERTNLLQGIDAASLTLTKVRYITVSM